MKLSAGLPVGSADEDQTLGSAIAGAVDEEEVQTWPYCALNWRGIDVATHVWLTPIVRNHATAQDSDTGPHSRAAVAQRLSHAVIQSNTLSMDLMISKSNRSSNDMSGAGMSEAGRSGGNATSKRRPSKSKKSKSIGSSRSTASSNRED